jgi:DNA-binding CsgD family transcriptional regulator
MRKENRSNSPPTYIEALEKLSPREVEIVKRVKEGETSNEIAKKLGISSRSVHTHRHNICTKLKLEGKNALLKWVLWAMKDE